MEELGVRNWYFAMCAYFAEKYAGTKNVVFIQSGTFFEVYGKFDKNTNTYSNNLTVVADIMGIQVVRTSTTGIFNAGVKTNVFRAEKYLGALMSADWTVILIEQCSEEKYLESLANGLTPNFLMPATNADNNVNKKSSKVKPKAKTKSGDDVYRAVTEIYTPGTYIVDNTCELKTTITTNVVTSIWISSYSEGKKTMLSIGMSAFNVCTGNMWISQEIIQFISAEITVFNELEQFLVLHQPVEVIGIIENNLFEIVPIESLIRSLCPNAINVKISQPNKRSTNCTKQVYQFTVLNQLFTEEWTTDNRDQILEYETGIASAIYLIDYMQSQGRNLLNNTNPPTFEKQFDTLQLGNVALKQLNIVSADASCDRNSSMSSLLNWCSSPMGKREFVNQLTHPTVNVETLEQRYELTERLLGAINSLCDVRIQLEKIHDLDAIMRMYYRNGQCALSFKHYQSIYKAATLATIWTKRIFGQTADISQFIKLKDKLAYTFVETFEGYAVYDDAIWLAMKEKDECKLKIETLAKYLNGYISEKKDVLKLSSSGVYTMTCTKTQFEKLKERVKPTTMSTASSSSSSSSTDVITFNGVCTCERFAGSSNDVYIKCSLFDELSGQYSSLNDQINDYINTIIIPIWLTEFKTTWAPIVVKLSACIASIDVAINRAFIAEKYSLVKPTIASSSDNDVAEKSFVNITDLRHLLIEQLIKQQKPFITNDFSEEDNQLLVFGTNAAGKTSYIRAIGIAIIMAQAGLFVPASTMIYIPYNALFTRILGNDNLHKGHSTFQVEMYEVNTILKSADSATIILGDEVCSGTETSSAISIFTATLKHLLKTGSTFVFATHLHEIMPLIENDPIKCKHFSMYYDRARNEMVYNRKLANGSGGKLYGLEVCQSLHMPTSFLENAYKIRHDLEVLPLDCKVSQYNSRKIVHLCEVCGKKATEVHHIIPQEYADEKGYVIDNQGNKFHMNSLHNLKSLCEICHLNTHGKHHK